jgi:hypothetical protein
LVEVIKILGRPKAKLHLIHLPSQASTVGQFGRGNILPFLLRLLKTK